MDEEMKEVFEGKEILVTGGTGSIGKEIVKSLLQYDIERVVVFSRDEIKQFYLKKEIQSPKLELFVGDVRDYKSVERVFTEFNFDIVYHAAAMKHVIICEDFPVEATMTNIIGTQNVCDVARREGVKKLITISTDKAVHPINVMGASKLIAEKITINANYTCVRFGNVACSRGSVIPALVRGMLYKNEIYVTDPNVTRFIMRISDAVKLILKATKYSKGGEIFILKMPAFTLEDLVKVLVDRIAPKLGISKVNVKWVELMKGEKVNEELVSTSEVDNIYELEDMFVISNNFHGKKAKINKITSADAKKISKNELERIVEECLKVIGYDKNICNNSNS